MELNMYKYKQQIENLKSIDKEEQLKLIANNVASSPTIIERGERPAIQVRTHPISYSTLNAALHTNFSVILLLIILGTRGFRYALVSAKGIVIVNLGVVIVVDSCVCDSLRCKYIISYLIVKRNYLLYFL